MSGLVPGSSMVSSALSTSLSFITNFAPVLSVVVGIAVFGVVVVSLSRLWRG